MESPFCNMTWVTRNWRNATQTRVEAIVAGLVVSVSGWREAREDGLYNSPLIPDQRILGFRHPELGLRAVMKSLLSQVSPVRIVAGWVVYLHQSRFIISAASGFAPASNILGCTRQPRWTNLLWAIAIMISPRVGKEDDSMLHRAEVCEIDLVAAAGLVHRSWYADAT